MLTYFSKIMSNSFLQVTAFNVKRFEIQFPTYQTDKSSKNKASWHFSNIWVVHQTRNHVCNITQASLEEINHVFKVICNSNEHGILLSGTIFFLSENSSCSRVIAPCTKLVLKVFFKNSKVPNVSSLERSADESSTIVIHGGMQISSSCKIGPFMSLVIRTGVTRSTARYFWLRS